MKIGFKSMTPPVKSVLTSLTLSSAYFSTVIKRYTLKQNDNCLSKVKEASRTIFNASLLQIYCTTAAKSKIGNVGKIGFCLPEFN